MIYLHFIGVERDLFNPSNFFFVFSEIVGKKYRKKEVRINPKNIENLSFEIIPEKYCIGFHTRDFKFYTHSVLIGVNDTQCDICRKKDPFLICERCDFKKCENWDEFMKRMCNSEHYVYVGFYGRRILFDYTPTYLFLLDIYEKGYVCAIPIVVCKNRKKAVSIVKRLYKLFRLPEKAKKNLEKVIFYEVEGKEFYHEKIKEIKEKIQRNLHAFPDIKPTDLLNKEPIFPHYYEFLVKNRDNFTLNEFCSELSGKCVDLVGNFLIINKSGKYFVYNIRNLLGYLFKKF